MNFRNSVYIKWLVILFSSFLLIQSVSAKDLISGKFILKVVPSNIKDSASIDTFIKKDGRLYYMINNLNDNLKLPHNIIIIFKDDDRSPYYDPETKEIIFGYKYILYLTHIYLHYFPKEKPEVAADFVLNVVRFILYHEIAHALVHAYDLPVLGNEEGAADDLATIITLEFVDGGYQITLDTLDYLDMSYDYDSHRPYDSKDYWDEHALDIQRFYRITCLFYGKDPSAVVNLFKRRNDQDALNFLRNKSDYCRVEYQRQRSSWGKILSPHLKEHDKKK